MKKQLKRLFFLPLLFLTAALVLPWQHNGLAAEELALSENPLAPVKTDNPRDTMQSFMKAMNDYKKGVEENNPQLENKINSALRCLDLSGLSTLSRHEKGVEAAIMLKEVMDRVIVIDYSKIPEQSENPNDPLTRWRLRHTEIVIQKMTEGDRAGEFLFSTDTVLRAPEFFSKVKHLSYLQGSGHGAGYQTPWFERYVPAWAKEQVFLLQTWQWIALVLAILIGLILKTVVRHSLGIIKLFVSKAKVQFINNMLEAALGPSGYIIATVFWFVSLNFLKFEGETLAIFNVILKVFLSANIIWLSYRITGVLSDVFTEFASKTESTLDDHLVPLLSKTLKIFVVIFGILFTAQNLGFNVMSLIAGLGIGGLAFALAAKDTVANFFGSLMVLFDSPFQVGDWIVIKDSEGTVEEIGFRSTRVRTFYNSLISIPNSELMSAAIDNMGRRQYRRVLAKLGVTYDTSPEKMEAFLEGIKNIIKANPHTRKDYFHVVFNEFGDSGLIVMVYFFLKVPDWSNELVEKQNVFLEIMRLAKELKVEFAFPTQTLHVETFPEKTPTRIPENGNREAMQNIASDFSAQGGKAKPAGMGIFTPPFKE